MKSNSSFSLGLAVVLLSLGSLPLLPHVAQAQTQGPSVTVQLPEFHYFGVSTSVLVPDRGTAYMGGIGSSSSGSSSYGGPILPFRNRGMGQSAGASSTSVSAWVHDFQAMDEAVLTEAQRRNNGEVNDLRPSDGVRQRWPLSSLDETPPDNTLVSAEEHARRQADKQDEQQAEAQRHFEKAQSLVAEGKPGVARIYFQMALRRAEGPLKAEITAALAASRGPQVAAESK
jgi:hypothetical protein